MEKALKLMKSDNSPGPDGIIAQFYKIFWEVIKDDLISVFHQAYYVKKLTYSQYLALIILLYKKDTREDIRNWRPISLSNTDIKIISKIFAERLKLILPDIINPEQTGGVKDRKIGHCIRLIDDVFEELNDENLIIQTDKQKAFDLVEWKWLFYVLKSYDFGEYFINWLQIIYQGMKSAVVTNGWVSKYFPLTRGIRQGDALSALLYIIQAEPLAECIRKSKEIKGIEVHDCEGTPHEFKGTQYVDDSTNMILNSHYLSKCFEIINFFGEASGSRINKGKSVALVSEHFQDGSKIDENITIKICSEIDKSLGVPIGKGNCRESFWNGKIDKIKNKLNFWQLRNLTMVNGKIHITRSLLLPLVQYASTHTQIDKKFIDEIQILIWKFVWKWSYCLVRKELCFLPKSMGGLGLPSFHILVKAARVKLIIEIMEKPQKWNIIARKHIKCLDSYINIENFAMIANDTSELIQSSKIPEIYKSCLTFFQELCRKGRIDTKNPVIWGNNRIKFRGKCLFFKQWAKCGINLLSDVTSEGILDSRKIEQRLTKNADFIFEFSQLNKALRSSGLNLNTPETINKQEITDMFFRVPGVKEPKNIFKLTSKDIYSILLSPHEIENKSELYWINKFNRPDIPFNIWYCNLFDSKVIPRKAIDFNWRIFHGQILTEKRLEKMKKSDGFCIICKKGKIEDVLHCLIECESVQGVWRWVKKLILSVGVNELVLFNKIGGFITKIDKYNLSNMIVSVTRWVVWKRRCSIKYDSSFKPAISLTIAVKNAIKTQLGIISKSKIISQKTDSTILKKFSDSVINIPV